MFDPLSYSKEGFAAILSRFKLDQPEPIRADPWITSSILQKSIRRGETGIAERAAEHRQIQRGFVVRRRVEHRRCGDAADGGCLSTMSAYFRSPCPMAEPTTRASHRSEGRPAGMCGAGEAGMLSEFTATAARRS